MLQRLKPYLHMIDRRDRGRDLQKSRIPQIVNFVSE